MSEPTAYPAAPAISYRPIGHVENAVAQPTPAEQIRAAESRIVLDPALVEGLRGLNIG